MTSKLAFLLSIIALAAWIVLAFVVAIPAGWPHLFLVAAVGFVIYAIANRDAGEKA